MKGLLYDYFLYSRGYLIGAVITFAVLTALGTAALRVFPTEAQSLLPSILPILGMALAVIVCEGGARYIEKLLKTRFLNHILSSRVSGGGFTLALLVMNLLSLAFGIVLAFLMFAILGLSDKSLLTFELFRSTGCLSAFLSAFNFMVYFPTLLFRSAEKGGMALGLILGFGIIFPIGLFVQESSLFSVSELLNDPMLLPIAGAICVGLYAVTYAAILLRIKGGDVC